MTATIETRPIVVDARDYGVTGDGVTDDTVAVQAAVDAAIAAGAKLFFPQPEVYYVISDTITLQPESGDLFRLDIEAQNTAVSPNFTPVNFHWSGGNNDTIFQGINWHYSEVRGIHIQISAANTGVTAWDIDCPTGNTFWVQFYNCGVAFQNSANDDCNGWRIGHSNAGGGGNSDHSWNGCYVIGTVGNVGQTNNGWVWENQQVLILDWTNCYATYLAQAWTGSPTSGSNPGNGGGNGHTWTGCGAGYNGKDFVPGAASGTFTINGGRFEQGNQFINVAGGTSVMNFIVNGAQINEYNPADGIIFYLNNPTSLVLNSCEVWRVASNYTNAMISSFTGNGGTIQVNGGSYRADNPFYSAYAPQVVNVSLDAQQIDASRVAIGRFADYGTVVAAATVVLPSHAKTCLVTGNTNITSVTATWAGDTRRLIFSGTPTFTDGSNLKLSANLVATADDSITLVCNGTNWYETGRSVN